MILSKSRSVSLEVQRLLPSVLIDYLWTLSEEGQTESVQVFLLTKQALAGKELQEIRHISDNAMSTHKVFGFDPVNACILIATQGSTERMEAGGLLEAMELATASEQRVLDASAK